MMGREQYCPQPCLLLALFSIVKWPCFRLSKFRRGDQNGPLFDCQVALFSLDKNKRLPFPLGDELLELLRCQLSAPLTTDFRTTDCTDFTDCTDDTDLCIPWLRDLSCCLYLFLDPPICVGNPLPEAHLRLPPQRLDARLAGTTDCTDFTDFVPHLCNRCNLWFRSSLPRPALPVPSVVEESLPKGRIASECKSHPPDRPHR
jgi:hypothetical protein